MFGIASMELSWAFVLCIFASLICVAYGIANWNNAGPTKDDLVSDNEAEKLKRT